MNALRILLADDNPAFLEIAARILADCPQVKIVGRAATGREAVALAGELAPDLMLMDISMPEMNGLEATRQLRRSQVAARIILMTIHDNAEYPAGAKAAGADALIRKRDLSRQLLATIQSLFPGHAFTTHHV